MKKILSSALLISATIMTFGQVLVNENFETLTAGNLGTDVTGTTSGQNGWYTLYGANTDYQVATIDAAHGKSLTIASYNSYSATTASLNNRIAAKLTTVTATASNNILHGKFDLYTGPSTGAGTIQMRVLGMNGTASTTIGGFTYDVATKELRGLSTFTNISTGAPTVYSIGLAAAPGVLLTANTWVSLNFKYNKTTGAIVWTWPTGSGGYTSSTSSLGLIPAMVGKDVYLYNVTSTGNTVSKIAGFDNVFVEFSNAAALSTNELTDNNIKATSITIFPNPTLDVLNIKSESKINKVAVTDLAGKNVNVRLNGNSLDVRHLPTGTYFISVETKDGFITEKFIKK